jgi:hypothetical protein
MFNGKPEMSGHGWNGFLNIFSFNGKHGKNEIIHGKFCFPYHTAKCLTLAKTPGTVIRKQHNYLLLKILQLPRPLAWALSIRPCGA